MKRLMRSLITGGVVGVAVGVTMLFLNKKSQPAGKMLRAASARTGRNNERTLGGARSAVKMVRDNTMRWTSAMKDGTEAISKRLTRRLT